MIKIVTASSSNHYLSSIQFLNSIIKFNYDIIYYDIGLTSDEVKDLQNKFPSVLYKKFMFNDYPSYVNLEFPCSGAYAWKPLIVSLESHFDGILIWCDAGNIVTKFENLIDIIKLHSIYTPISSGSIKKWTHPDTLKIVKTDFSNKRGRNAAFIGFDLSQNITKQFISKWKYYALQKNIILPNGAHRGNHRWDQSILSLLFYDFKINEIDHYIDFTIHNDVERQTQNNKLYIVIAFIILLWVFKKSFSSFRIF